MFEELVYTKPNKSDAPFALGWPPEHWSEFLFHDYSVLIKSGYLIRTARVTFALASRLIF